MTSWSWMVQRNRSMHIARCLLTYRWVTQHTTSCPLAGVVGCVLPTCLQGSAEPGSRGLGWGENKWVSFWGLVLLFPILVSVLLVSTWIYIRRRHRHCCRRPSRPAVHFPCRSCARWVGGRRWRLSRRRRSLKGAFFFLGFFFFFGKNYAFSQEYGYVLLDTAEYASS